MSKAKQGNPKFVRLSELKGWKAVRDLQMWSDNTVVVAEYKIYNHKHMVGKLSVYGTLLIYDKPYSNAIARIPDFGHNIRKAMKYVYLKTQKSKS